MNREIMDDFYIRMERALNTGTPEQCKEIMNEREAYLKSIQWEPKHIKLLEEYEKKDRKLIEDYMQRHQTIKSVSKESFDANKRRDQFKLYE